MNYRASEVFEMSAKSIVLFATYSLMVTSLCLFAGIQLYQSIYRISADFHISELRSGIVAPDAIGSTSMLAQRIQSFPIQSANDLEIRAKLREWERFLEPRHGEYKEMIDLRMLSMELRPTWSPNYVELSKLYDGIGDSSKQQAMLRYAETFGTARRTTIIGKLDFSFSNWDTLNIESKQQAAISLIEVTNRPSYRRNLDNMITYSKGKERICNLLFFNDLHVASCY